MNILFVIKSLAGPAGGAERVISLISSSLAARFHDVSMLSFDPPGSQDFYPVSPSVSRFRFGLGSASKRSSPLEILQRVTRTRRLTKSLRADVAIGFMHSAFVPLGIALWGKQIPVIGCERTAYRHYQSRPLERLTIRATLPLFDCLTVNNEGVREGYPRAIAQRMKVLHNPVASLGRSADVTGSDRKVLLAVGQLRPEKGHSILLAAFARVAVRFPDWRLRLVGDGALMTGLQFQAKSLGIAHAVEFAGVIEEVTREYQSAQLFVLPSFYEGFPNSLAEALSHGLPAIGFEDCPGTNELIESGINGYLVRGADRVERLALALEESMASPERRRQMSVHAIDSVKPYGIETVTDEWERLLSSAVQRSKERGGKVHA